MKEKIILMDGATGTRLWAMAAETGAEKQPVWRYNLTHPELVERAAKEYAAAGSTLLCTNTFAANGPELARHADVKLEDVIRAGVRIARKAVAGTEAKIALDMGPLSQMLAPMGTLTPEQVTAVYAELLGCGLDEGVDYVFFETFMSLDMLCAAMEAAKDCSVPVLCSMSFQANGRTMMGDTPAEIARRLEAMGAAAVGLNCSFGPEAALPVIREYAAATALPLILKPNVDDSCTPERFAELMMQALPLLRYAGACCGSSPAHITALAERV